MLQADRNGADYQRSLFHNPGLAQEIHKRVRDLLPSGQYVSERFRFSHYRPGGLFSLHQDGVHQDPKTGDRSVKTLSVFLNDDYEGGETEFFEGNNLTSAESVFLGVPETGKAILFPREVYHRGNKVVNGDKYLLRTDIMSSH